MGSPIKWQSISSQKFLCVEHFFLWVPTIWMLPGSQIFLSKRKRRRSPEGEWKFPDKADPVRSHCLTSYNLSQLLLSSTFCRIRNSVCSDHLSQLEQFHFFYWVSNGWSPHKFRRLKSCSTGQTPLVWNCFSVLNPKYPVWECFLLFLPASLSSPRKIIAVASMKHYRQTWIILSPVKNN